MENKPTYEELVQRVEALEREAAQRVQLEKQLRLLSLAVEQSSEGIAVTDMDGNLVYLNDAFAKMHGYCAEELIGKNLSVFHTPEQMPSVEAANLVLEQTGSFQGEIWHVRRDGHIFPTLMRNSLVRDETKKPIGMMGTLRDITERKQAEEAFKASERSYQEIFNASNEAIFVHDRKTGAILDVNQTMCEMFGYTHAEAVKLDVGDLSQGKPPYTMDHARQWVRKAVEEGPQRFEWRAKRKNGELFWDETNLKHAVIGGQDCILAFVSDITERKQAEKALKGAYDIINRSPAIAFLWKNDENWPVEFVSDNVRDLFGYTADEFTSGQVVYGMTIHPDDLERVKQEIVRYSKNEGIEAFIHTPYRIVTKGGKVKWIDDRTHIRRDEKGTITHYQGIVEDITSRKLVEEELLKEKNFSDLALNSLPGIFYLFDENGNMNRWNNNFEAVSGYSADEIRRMKPTDFFAQNEKERVAQRIQEVFTKGKSYVEASLATKNNRKIPHHFTGYRMVIDGKKFALGIGIDISGQKRVEEALRKSEKRYRVVVEDMPAMICRFLPDGTLTFTNNSYGDFFNKKPQQLIGQNFFQFIPEAERNKVRDHFVSLNQNMPITTYEHQVIAPDRSIRWQEWTDRALFDEQGHVVEYQSIGRDITENKLAQEETAKIQKQFQQSQKMEAIGTLAGGIAHDFNNILGAIIGYAGMMEMFDVPEDSPMMAKIKEVLKAANRAKDLVEQILTFSRQTEQERQPIQLNYIVKEALKFLRASLPTTIEFRQYIGNQEFIAMADSTQMYQILMNLCTNAGHAMQETGGRLEVALSALDLDAQAVERYPELKPGPHLKLTVSDSGHGMTAEVLEQIFDPFFTTKKPGEGTGMGLAVVHGIVKSHEGVVTVDSELGRGTVFQIILPRIEMGTIEPPEETEQSIPKGTERILFIDDEKYLTTLAQEILERFGYVVTVRTSSREALELFRLRPEKFDMVISDQTMPHMTGLELAREMIKIRSDIPVILCTGYSETATPERVRAAGVRELIYKPLNPSRLAQTIRKVLDDRIDD